jgi:poly(3-hydroxybutyrate) depolymerase
LLTFAGITLPPIKAPLWTTHAEPRGEPEENPMRTDVTFRSGDDWCAGWLYRPEGFEGPRPLMVMAHGFSGTKELRLPAYAERFGDAGIGVLLFD